MKVALYWDVENISSKYVFSRLSSKIVFNKKLIVHHEENSPYSQNHLRALTKRNYNVVKTNYFKNSADIYLIKEIEKDINNFDSFYIISDDHIFAEIIVTLLKLNKTVVLFTKKKNDDLKLFKEIKELLGFVDKKLFYKIERV